MKIILNLLRIIVGVLFIFSGLIKANDPLGLSYKMEEFFEVLHLTFLSPYSLAFSIIMNAFEIIAGVAVLIGYRMRIFSVLLLLLIIFFTFLTGYALFSGTIRECGCFGDCIKLTAVETFWKDVILLVMILVIFFYRNTIQPLFKGAGAVFLLSVLFAFGIQRYTLKHLPLFDCLPYKVGNNIPEKMKLPPGATPDVYEMMFIYEKNGEKKEFTADNYPWSDSTWKFVDRKDKLVKKGNAEPAIKDFILTDLDGVNQTEAILSESKPVYLFLVLNTQKAGSGWDEKIKALQQQWKNQQVVIYGVTASTKEEIAAFKQQHGLEFPFVQMDGVAIKTAGRSNPALILLNKGTIKGKWHYNDIP
ncbi:DoxX protein [Chitinophaga ginsengisegetis]|uniref:DoxX protein n=1 Tax=Chitinophaga ginsengisegetis TaxID=393003 RepID=A0A1T5P7S5_9BACT|nr:BT_3928 family protein [Chitinophaga ginsengisegetis]MDR6567818.1 putative membrane protein YphA (DoxX/SURF4 family) [Chitinophaga ginsengisegetis]MDR6647627.1 putative membrane protein YphA (DoxX/SURF4 family) [Chitinophaga ginsengisegetis]MDR6653977.1 putative membrane protein YphA (DoxX/SURF4 family) [Chitinophaga ginsengisegetis]SKD08775.1 DoxX protein [Chitinophaga ginsengisegetis]